MTQPETLSASVDRDETVRRPAREAFTVESQPLHRRPKHTRARRATARARLRRRRLRRWLVLRDRAVGDDRDTLDGRRRPCRVCGGAGAAAHQGQRDEGALHRVTTSRRSKVRPPASEPNEVEAGGHAMARGVEEIPAQIVCAGWERSLDQRADSAPADVERRESNVRRRRQRELQLRRVGGRAGRWCGQCQRPGLQLRARQFVSSEIDGCAAIAVQVDRVQPVVHRFARSVGHRRRA